METEWLLSRLSSFYTFLWQKEGGGTLQDTNTSEVYRSRDRHVRSTYCTGAPHHLPATVTPHTDKPGMNVGHEKQEARERKKKKWENSSYAM